MPLTGKEATAFRAAQVVRKNTITTRAQITNVCRTETAGDERVNQLRDARILKVYGNLFGNRDGVGLHPELGSIVGVGVGHGEVAVTVASADLKVGRPEPLVTAKSNVESDGAGTLDVIADSITQVLADDAQARAAAGADGAERDVIGIGVAVPGLVRQHTGEISTAAQILPGWHDADARRPAAQLADRLKHALPGVAIAVDNDASVGALGVLTWERLQAHTVARLDAVPRDLIYVRVGAGIGAGIVTNGQLVRGGSGFAGEVGHMKVDDHGPLCPRCGQRGCAETKASAPYVISQVAGRNIINFPSHTPASEKLARLVESSHPACERALWDAGRYVGLALGHACTLLNPSRIYLGGVMTDSLPFVSALNLAVAETALTTETADGTAQRLGQPVGDLIQPLPRTIAPRGGGSCSPELLGALMLVLDAFGDSYIEERIMARQAIDAA